MVKTEVCPYCGFENYSRKMCVECGRDMHEKIESEQRRRPLANDVESRYSYVAADLERIADAIERIAKAIDNIFLFAIVMAILWVAIIIFVALWAMSSV